MTTTAQSVAKGLKTARITTDAVTTWTFAQSVQSTCVKDANYADLTLTHPTLKHQRYDITGIERTPIMDVGAED